MLNVSDRKNDYVDEQVPIPREATDYRKIISELPVGIMRIDTGGQVLYVNRRLLEILGSPSCENTVPAEQLACEALKEAGIRSVVRDCVRNDREIIVDMPYTSSREGDLCLRIRARPEKDELGHITGCICTVDDVPGIRQAETSREQRMIIGSLIADIPGAGLIQQQKSLLASTFDSIPDLLAVIDKDLRVVMSNWKERDYISEGEKASNPFCYRCFMHRDEPCDPCHAMEVFRTGKVKTVERTNPVDGKTREIRVMPIFDDNGRVSLVIEHIRDMTERKKAEQLVIDARLAAEEANRTKSEFIANMSHELRTPLNSVIGFSELLLDETFGPLNEKQMRHVKNIFFSGKHLLGLINDILDLSKVEAGKMDLNLEEFCIADVAGDVITTLRPMSFERDIDISNHIPLSVSVRSDKSKIRQVFYNLLSNAIKFTPDNGCITVGTEMTGDIVNVYVRDTGVGISNEDMDKLFQPFRQIDASYIRKYDGTGLGLALVKKLVEMQGGSIRVESEPGKGSVFTFTVPGCKRKGKG